MSGREFTVSERSMPPTASSPLFSVPSARISTTQDKLAAHMSVECPMMMVACKFKSIGCDVKMERSKMPSHEADNSHHLHLALNAVTQLKESTRFREQTLGSKYDTITFAVSEYEKKKKQGLVSLSPSFYTSPNGYHMRVQVNVGTHVSAYVSLLDGDYDGSLKWPFVGGVRFSLLNQLQDQNHRMVLANITPVKNMRKGGETRWGQTKFISHSELAHNSVKNTQYLKEDTLYFRVSVEVDKPWLQCGVIQDAAGSSMIAEWPEDDATLKSNESKVFALFGYKSKKEAGETVILPSFYTSPNGYQVAVRVDANGHGDGKGTHLSVFAAILKGKYDAGLKWPFVGEVKVTLLNQISDSRHLNKVIPFTAELNKRAIENPRGVGPIGCNKLIPNSDLALHQGVQYLKDDALYFKVSAKVADLKLWLE